MAQRLVVSFLLLSCLAAQWQMRAAASAHKTATTFYEHVFYLPPPNALKVFSLGHQEALADLLWVRALVYLGEESIRNLAAKDLLNYGNAVVALDPFFGRAYRVFAISANGRPGLNEEELTARVRQSIAFLEEGVRHLPNDAELAWDTGSVYAFTLAPRLKDEREYREAKRRGVEHLQAATLRGAGPPWAGLTNVATLVRLGQTEQAIAHLQELDAVTSDPDVRTQIGYQLARLRSESFAEGWQRTSSELAEQHRRDFPYVSETMYLLLGKRPVFDGVAQYRAHFDPAFQSATDESEDDKL